MLDKLLYLNAGEFRRLLPYFGLYFVLFAALTVADGLALTLFVQKVGADALPTAYRYIALLNFAILAAYIRWADRVSGERIFQVILGVTVAVLVAAYVGLEGAADAPFWAGVLFVGREIAFTLILMHFGTFLQDYFTRAEMNRVLPVVYSGGRLGGIAGGAGLQWLSGPLGLSSLLVVCACLIAAAMVLIRTLAARGVHVHAPEDAQGDPGVTPAHVGADVEERARGSLAGFLRYIWVSPLLFWLTITSILFMACRWILNYQYSTFFAEHFEDETDLARFLGLYTQIALVISLVLQTLVTNRLIAWIGIRGTHLLYSGLVVAGTATSLWHMTLGLAVFARFIETELRFGLRNPITMLITNKFSKALRTRVRAWTLGVINPIATLAVSEMLSVLVAASAQPAIAGAGAVLGAGYFATSLWLARALRQPQPVR